MIESLFPLGVSQYLIGGILVGIGIGIPYLLTGLVASASTFFSSTWSYFTSGWFFQRECFTSTRTWRIALALGLVTGGFIYYLFVAHQTATVTEVSLLRLFFGGLCIGIGTKMSGGCTSGHGICGNASLEKVSLVATITFLTVAILIAKLTSYSLGL